MRVTWLDLVVCLGIAASGMSLCVIAYWLGGGFKAP
jgi:hypothetical protein